MAEPAIVVDDVCKTFRLYHERNQSLKAAVMRKGRARYTELQALDHVSFEVPKGKTFGIIGHNGSGKSTMLKCLARILRPDSGKVTTVGKVSALLELGAGFHPELSGRDNVYLNGSILGLSKKEIDKRYDDIVSFAFADSGQEDRIDTPVKNYSSGMYVKLGFSVAINVDPDLLLVDEVLTVGDELFQRKCADKFLELKDSGKTIVIVSHALGMVRDLCDEVALLDHGRLRTLGSPDDAIDAYLGGIERNARRDGDFGMRFGEGGAGVERVELLDEHGAVVDRLTAGRPCTVRVHWFTDAPVERPVWRLEVHSLSGQVIASSNTRYHHQVPEVAVGRGSFDYHIERLALIGGTYDLSATFFDFECRQPYDVRHRFVRFRVDQGDARDSEGVFSLGGEFTGGILPIAPPVEGS